MLLQTPPANLQDSLRRGQNPEHREPWPRLFKAFVVVDWRDNAGPRQLSFRRVNRISRELLEPGGSPPKATARLRNGLDEFLDAEGCCNRFIRGICEDIRQSDAFRSRGLTKGQILDEIDDRAIAHYEQLWANCSDDEKVVLGHVAQVTA